MIRWGILGAGKIADRFAQSLVNEKDSCLYAIAARNKEKAEVFREKHPFKMHYSDYDAFLNDEKIDAVYIALPHGLHKEWIVKSLKKHKAVLCEKPAVLNAKEMEEVIAVSKEENTLFMEAMKPRFTPMYQRMKTMIEEGVIGNIKEIKTSICFVIPKEMEFGSTYHTQPGHGGCLLDSGIYCASLLMEFMKEPIHLDQIYANVYKGIDMYVDAHLSDGNINGRLEVGFDRSKPRDAEIIGSKGSIYIHDFHRPRTIDLTVNEVTETIEMPYEYDDFYSEIHHFCTLIRQGKTESNVMPLNESYRFAKLLDLIRNGFTQQDESDLAE